MSLIRSRQPPFSPWTLRRPLDLVGLLVGASRKSHGGECKPDDKSRAFPTTLPLGAAL